MTARTTYSRLITVLIFLTAFASFTVSADSPRLRESVTIHSIEIIGSPTAGSTVELNVIYSSNVDGEARLILNYPGSIKPLNASSGESRREEPVTLVKGQTVERRIALIVEKAVASHISVGISLVNPIVGYLQGDSRYLNVANIGRIQRIYNVKMNIHIRPYYLRN